MPTMSADRQLTKQGWIQTALVIIATISAGSLAYGRLEAKTDRAAERADTAFGEASTARTQANVLQLELLKFEGMIHGDIREIKALLQQRLPERKESETPK